jgi:hypothetical protein
MFSVTQWAPDPARGELRALCLSLNTPVVAIDALPVSPARAGIALQIDSGGPRVILAIRSLRSGVSVFYRAEEDLYADGGPERAVAAAHTLAESMGFLFENDSLEAQGDAEETARLWSELLELTVTHAPAVPPAPEPPGEVAVACVADTEPARPPPALVLTKFRNRGAIPAARYIGTPELVPVLRQPDPV